MDIIAFSTESLLLDTWCGGMYLGTLLTIGH